LLADSHVRQYWDPGQLTGRWFGDRVNGGGLAWDVYFLYGPNARWDAASPLSTGSPVIANTDHLSAALQQAQRQPKLELAGAGEPPRRGTASSNLAG